MTRRSRSFGLFMLGLLVLSGLMAAHAALSRRASVPALRERARLVRSLELTDLCLSTEANYARHISLADFHTAFQDHPLALEHFPSGSLLGPPPHLRRSHGQLD